MISAMPAVAVRRERKKSRSSSRGSAPTSHHSSQSSISQARTIASMKRGHTQSVSTLSSGQSSYVSALHKVRSRREEMRKERMKFMMYIGSVLVASGLSLVFIGIAIGVSAAQTIGLLFIGIGALACLVRVFCFPKQTVMVKKARAVTGSGQSIYHVAPSNVTTPAMDDYYFPALPLHRLPLSPTQETTTTVHSIHSVHSVHSNHSNHSNPSSILTPMSLNSIPEMQVLITDENQRY